MNIERNESKGSLLSEFVNDLMVLKNGVSKHQKPSNVMRRAIVSAVRKGRKKGPDDGDTLGVSNIGFKDAFEDEAGQQNST